MFYKKIREICLPEIKTYSPTGISDSGVLMCVHVVLVYEFVHGSSGVEPYIAFSALLSTDALRMGLSLSLELFIWLY